MLEIQGTKLSLRRTNSRATLLADTGEPACGPRATRALSPVKRRWSLDDRNPTAAWEPVPFNLPMVWRFSGALDTAKLGQAAQEVVARHTVLRCSLQHVDGGWRYVAGKAPAFRLQILLNATGEPTGSEEAAMKALSEFVWRPFLLESESPFRVGVARTKR